MLDELNAALETYEQKWQKLISVRHERQFLASLKPMAVGWKVKDQAEFDKRFQSIRDACDQIHLGWINDRWLATMHLKDISLANDATVVKLMQRRPNSTDAIGLDHIDFLVPESIDAKSILSSEADLQWTEENNGEHCKWLSIWFADTEAKLRTNSVLQVCIDELKELQQQIGVK